MEYQAQFENIFNCMLGLPPEALLYCFISSLRNNGIHNELMMLKHYNLANAIGLAKLVEEKLAVAIPPFNRFPWPPRSLAPSSLVLGLPPTPSALPIRKLYIPKGNARASCLWPLF